ncbi:MAG: HEAT repeat domain-containing protein [Desmonostoc vinosum HA7617-LM4]|jgi:HEAT repeat protein|nr:HEAT repeat domain-containing protein [Desmonostoc vinosum HA7617-LM4]
MKEEAELVLQHIDRTKAIAALVQLLRSNHLKDHTCIQIVSGLGKIGTNNEIAIAALVQLLQSTNLDDYTRIQVASGLGKIDSGNEIAIATLVELLLSPKLVTVGNNYEIPRRAAESLG